MKSSSKTMLRAAALTLAIGTIGFAHAADPMTSATGGNIPGADRTFIEKASLGGMTEIKASQLAEEKGTSPGVKEYAKHMVADHTKASEELNTLAMSKGVTPPGTLDKSHQSSVDKLAKLSGSDFDKAYTKQMVSDHKDTVSLFEKEAKSGKDADVKALAGKTLPTLKEHLQAAQTLNDNTKK